MRWGPRSPGLLRNSEEIRSLDPRTDYERIYQLQALYDFPFDTRIGLNLAFYRTFAIPGIAALLAHTGEFHSHAMKRSYDTGLVMYEVIAAGLDAPRGREMVRLLNRVHHRWSIPAEQYRYVLASFIVTPTRWLDAHGWRSLSSQEREGTTTFYAQLGRRMAIPDVPTTYREAEDILDTYERDHLAPSEAGAALIAATLPVMADQFPRPLRPHVGRILSAMLGDPELCRGLGLPAPTRVGRGLLHAGLAARNAVRRRQGPATESWFKPGTTGHQVYPQGYELGDLGPKLPIL